MVYEPTAAGLHRFTTHSSHSLGGYGPLHADSAEASELLEALDDAMFTAIAGDADSAAPARELWTAALRLLPVELVAESREQYLRFALDTAQRMEATGVRNPANAFVALELLEFLTAEG